MKPVNENEYYRKIEQRLAFNMLHLILSYKLLYHSFCQLKYLIWPLLMYLELEISL
jgi:hypothetical protein